MSPEPIENKPPSAGPWPAEARDMATRLRRCTRPGQAMAVLAEVWPAVELSLPPGQVLPVEFFCGFGGRIFLPVVAEYVLGCDRSTLTRAMSDSVPWQLRLRAKSDGPRR